ncbi:MAG: hypothetical protein [Olavius algarvensis Gamma 3 endosymbiont]|nr:MAG: hypothetical protein [Olavius algarvensis Gamma 3 endosymbiont]
MTSTVFIPYPNEAAIAFLSVSSLYIIPNSFNRIGEQI